MTASDHTPDDTITVRGLTKRYGDVEALRGVDFRVGAGEVVGFLGPNGAGKTTTMKILTGFTAATSGEAFVAGHDVSEESHQARKKIGYLPERVPLYEDMLVYDYLNFIAEIQEITGDRRHRRILEVAEQTGITDVLGKTIHQLSKGYRQRVGLSQAIIHEPEVIILDEPTTGLDPNQIVEFRDVITTIGREKTVVLSTHVLQEVSAVCDRIIIICQGKIVADGTFDELKQTPRETLEDVFRRNTTAAPEINNNPETEHDPETETEIDHDPEPEPESESESETESETDNETETETETEHDHEIDNETETETEIETETETETEIETEIDNETESEHDPETESETEHDPEIESETEHDPEIESEHDPEIETAPETDKEPTQ